MYTFNVRNVNWAVPLALATLRDHGLRIAPRGQPTLELPGAVATVYAAPEQMVLFDPVRDANPFFHFFEALWILQGRNDVEFLAFFNSKMREFSDDGKTFHAPYGYRLRHNWPDDQIEQCVEKLRGDKDSRQCVMTIWDPELDWQRTKDVPCNDFIMLKVREGKLRMTVCNRSNDVVWGAYGANVVQFSTLLVYLARRIGVEVGEYTQISDSFHVYVDNPYWNAWAALHHAGVPPVVDPYLDLRTDESKWMTKDDFISDGFDSDLHIFFSTWDQGNVHGAPYSTQGFKTVVLPMAETILLWKQKQFTKAMGMCATIEAPDWRMACSQWMARRIKREQVEA